MLAFRSLDPFRALREPDRRRRDEERLSRSEQRTLSKTQNNHLTGKAPYKFESTSLQRRVTCEPELRFSRHRPALLWIRRAREKRLPPPLSSRPWFLECLPASCWSRFESPSGHAGSELFFREKTAASRET